MLTIEQRAARAAKRRNKKTAQAVPLFAEHFAVTVESQVERLQKQEVSNDKFFAEMLANNEQKYALGQQYRSIAQTEMDAEKFAEIDARYERIFGQRPHEHQGVWLADWWHTALRNNGSAWLKEHCSMPIFHEMESHQQAGRCPSCGRPLTLRTVKLVLST